MLIISDRQVAGEQKHFFPIFVNERRCRVDAWRKARQPGPAAALVGLVERSRQDLLLNTRGITGRSLPSLRHVEGVEFTMALVDGHLEFSWEWLGDRSGLEVGRSFRRPRRPDHNWP